MSRKILFFLSSDNFYAQVWKNGTLEAPYYFSNSSEGLERFTEFLLTHRDPAYLMVDLIEEDFRQEVVPHLTGSNHQSLVHRKFDQHYRSTPFRLATLQRRHPTVGIGYHSSRQSDIKNCYYEFICFLKEVYGGT